MTITPRERAEALWDRMLGENGERSHDKWLDLTEAAITEHVRALLAETPETMQLLTYGPLDEEDARWTLTTLRRKALGE